MAASATFRAISAVVAVCCSTALAIVLWMSLIWPMIVPIWRNGFDGAFGVGLDRVDLAADIFRGFGCLLGEFFDFVGNDCESLARFAGPRRFDRGVEGQQDWSAARSK